MLLWIGVWYSRVMDKTCSIDGCDAKVISRGWCRRHYTRWYETGSTELGVRNSPQPPPRVAPRPLPERFWPKVDKDGPEGCWIWTAGKNGAGYGEIWSLEAGKKVFAHRASWEMANGRKIPSGKVIDHLCRRPACVNPEHLEVVTVSENTGRGLAPSAGAVFQMAKTHCPQGHPYSESNTYRYGTRRVCRTCSIERTQERRRRMAQQ